MVLADDHTVVRSGLRLVLELEPDLEVVAEAGDVAGALTALSVHMPDVLILDLNMPGERSLPAIPRSSRSRPRAWWCDHAGRPGVRREGAAGALG